MFVVEAMIWNRKMLIGPFYDRETARNYSDIGAKYGWTLTPVRVVEPNPLYLK